VAKNCRFSLACVKSLRGKTRSGFAQAHHFLPTNKSNAARTRHSSHIFWFRQFRVSFCMTLTWPLHCRESKGGLRRVDWRVRWRECTITHVQTLQIAKLKMSKIKDWKQETKTLKVNTWCYLSPMSDTADCPENIGFALVHKEPPGSESCFLTTACVSRGIHEACVSRGIHEENDEKSRSLFVSSSSSANLMIPRSSSFFQ